VVIQHADIPRLYARFDLSNEAAGLSPRTRERYYARTIQQFQTWLQEKDQPMDRQSLEQFLSDARHRGLSPFTVRSYFGALRRFGAWIKQEGLAKKDPFEGIRIPKVPKLERQLPPDEAIDKLVAAASNLRDRAIVLLIVDANLRSEEARTLRMDKVYIQSRSITVLGKGNKERTIVVGAKAFKALLDYIEKERPPDGKQVVFLTRDGLPLSIRGFQNIFKRLRAKINGGFRLHDLRHYGSTQDASRGMGIFELMTKLGHTSPNQTLHYVSLAGKAGRGGVTADQLYNGKGPV